jgi:hypothetical protein
MALPDDKLALALVHDANIKLLGTDATDIGLEGNIRNVRRALEMAEKILSGKATDEDRASVPDLVHPQVRSLYLGA